MDQVHTVFLKDELPKVDKARLTSRTCLNWNRSKIGMLSEWRLFAGRINGTRRGESESERLFLENRSEGAKLFNSTTF